MALQDQIYSAKGTVIRLTLHSRSGSLFKFNPLLLGAGGFVRALQPDNTILPFKTSASQFNDNTLIFLDDEGNQVSIIRLELREKIIGITPLVIYPDGSTWEGLVGSNISDLKAMIWSPSLARRMTNPSTPVPWGSSDDWTAVPTSLLITADDMQPLCAQIEHSCCDPCK